MLRTSICILKTNLSMAANSVTSYLLFPIILFLSLSPVTLSGTLVEDLKNLHPPPDFNSTIMTNCHKNPSLRYCTSVPMNLDEVFKFTIVSSHLCNESKNPNCVELFSKIDLRSCPNVAPLYLSFDFFWKYCPLSIMSIDLSNNSLKGGFPSAVFCCTQITALDLSLNELSGDFPIQSFNALTNLTYLNLSYNCFSESDKLSDSQFFKRFNSSSFLHSGLLLDQKRFTVKAIILLVGFPLLVVITVIFLGWLCLQRPDFLPGMLQRKKRFTPAVLKAATAGFSNKNLVGKSDVVDIYRGILRDGTKVRIEIYRDHISRVHYRKFVKECQVLAQLRHKNLVRVLGWCKSRRLRAVVTEWSEGENAGTWLSRSAPPWNRRLKVLRGVAECMYYLQEEWPEVDYDLRTSSILLSDNLEPLISRFQVVDQNSIPRQIHKFGVFLLEMIVTRRAKDELDGGEDSFIRYIRMHNNSANFEQVIDERMELTEITLSQVKQALTLALLCTDQSRSRQPSLALICNIIARVYKTNLALPTANHRIVHSDSYRGHKRIQTR